MTSKWIRFAPVVFGLVAGGCDAMAGGGAGEDAAATDSAALAPALESITAEDVLAHVNVLADDSMEGRAPGSAGEEKTVRYLEDRFRALGLQPGNPDGSYMQAVPLVGITTETDASVSVGGEPVTLSFPESFVAVTRRVVPEIHIADSDIVFVGYGVVAPEYRWDDFADVDVAGKTIVMLVNDPPIPDAADTTRLDSTMFNGDAMTYY
ncbi:MAG: peptidase M28, partial [Longimicrobiales bacterium]